MALQLSQTVVLFADMRKEGRRNKRLQSAVLRDLGANRALLTTSNDLAMATVVLSARDIVASMQQRRLKSKRPSMPRLVGAVGSAKLGDL